MNIFISTFVHLYLLTSFISAKPPPSKSVPILCFSQVHFDIELQFEDGNLRYQFMEDFILIKKRVHK